MVAVQAPKRRRKIVAGVAGVAAVAIAATLAVLWPGYDAREVPPDHPSVWVLQTGDGKRYARVNSDLGELDTVREVENPSQLVQYGETAKLFAEGGQRVSTIDQASPKDLTDVDNEAFEQAPTETVAIDTAGEWIAYRTASGSIYAGRLSEAQTPVALGDGTAGGAETTDDALTGFGVGAKGEIAAVRERSGTLVMTRAGVTGQVSEWKIPETPESSTQLAHVGGRWVVLDDATGTLWVAAEPEPIATGLEPGSKLQQSGDAASTHVVVADSNGLTQVALNGDGVTRMGEGAGTPARPVVVGETVYGAWLTETSGLLWSSEDGERELEFADGRLSEDRVPVLTSNGSRVLLNEQSSGWVWSVPEGALLPSSLQWRSDEKTPQQTDSKQPERVLEPKPPVAEPDRFGVRAGESVLLPVLLNDHDPNEDVLTILPDSVTQPPTEFGSVQVANNEQHLVVDVAPDATGTATISYAVTDGTSTTGLNSTPTTVTLNVIGDDVNEAPVWCGVDRCLAEWPTVTVAPGGTQSVNVLDGWVDPEGDPLYLRGVLGEVDGGRVVATPDGTVTYQHSDPSATEARTSTVDVVVADTRGAESTQSLTIQVTPAPGLTLESSAVTGVAGRPIDLDLNEHLRGATGAARIENVTSLTEATGQNTEVQQGLTAVFEAAEPGSYVLQATIADELGDTNGLVRVTVIDPADAKMATVPLTAFVRPGEDATIDVTDAVSDPLRSVILLDDLDVMPRENTELTVNTIGQQYLRVAGDTPSGEPGVLGTATYRASDGSDNAGRSVRGEITFVLLPAVEQEAPIAADDRVTVRAGQQIDIAVLDNDTAPVGAHMVLDPEALVNDQEAGLAFATNRVVRYLAPDEPGHYTLSYRVHLLGLPGLTSTAKVHITVTGDEGSAPPTAQALEGRALAGQQVTIPFTPQVSSGGDVPRLDRVLTQPDLGTATLSPSGDAIIFSSTPGRSGQTQFTYRVKDAQGATGVGTVRVGVLGEEADPSPVTYSDYAEVQAGPDNRVMLSPLENDVDPGGRALSLTSVEPNAAPGTTEYEQLEQLLSKVDTKQGAVTIMSGETLGRLSYVYTAENERGDTATGMIVVNVVREHVPGYPKVLDTTLTSEDLGDLSNGVDVLTGKVTWNEGEIDELGMQLWRPTDGFSVKDNLVVGKVTEQAQIVPFAVSGESFDGNEVTSYGFLRVPGTEDQLLSIRSSYATVEVNENEHVDFDLAQAVSMPAGETLQLDAEHVAASGARSGATCRSLSGLTVRYEAGAGNPWQDRCTVPVKLSGQDEYTDLSVQLRVVPADPQPELRAASITVSPGATAQYDLGNMVQWNHNGAQPAVSLTTKYSGTVFDVTQQGTTLTVTAHDRAQPSMQETVLVEIEGTDAESHLALTVGRSPQTLPKGATVTAECSQAGGATSCTVPVIGQQGEVNPLPGTPLELVQVAQSSQCAGVTMAVENSSHIRVTWREDTGGAAGCQATFTVKDAQGRASTGERMGTLIFDLNGLPQAPSRLEWVGYTESSVTLRPVSDRASIPAVTGYEVRGGGKTVTCQAGQDCVVTGLENGTQQTFTATAINSVGESRTRAEVTAWAYRAPRAPKTRGAGWSPVANGTVGGLVRLDLAVPDPSTAAVTIRGGDQPVTVPVNGQTVAIDYSVGNVPTDLTVTPETRFAVPPSHVGSGSSQGTVLSITGTHGVGAPGLTTTVVPDSANNTIRVDVTVANNGARRVELGYSIDGAACVPARDNGTSHVFTGVTQGTPHTVEVCGEHVYRGQRGFGTTTTSNTVTLDIPAPADASYTVGARAEQLGDGSWVWPDVTTTAKPTAGYTLQFVSGNRAGQSIADVMPAAGNTLNAPISVRNCVGDGEVCSPTTQLSATGAASSPRVVFDPVADADGICVNPDLRGTVHVTGLASGWQIEQLTEGGVAFVRVSFAGLGLDSVESPRCRVVSGAPPQEGPSETPTERNEP